LVLIWYTYSTIGKFQPFGLDSNIDASIVTVSLGKIFVPLHVGRLMFSTK
jgi:hypothetical protein